MKALLPPWPAPERKPDIVWVPDLSAYAPREDCELWRGREWRLRASCDAVRRYTAGIQPEALDSRTVRPISKARRGLLSRIWIVWTRFVSMFKARLAGPVPQPEAAVSPKTTTGDTVRDRIADIREGRFPGG